MARQYGGDEHFYVASALHNIAGCYDKLEQYEKAEQFYRDAVKMKLDVLGDDHVSVAQSQVGLADVMLLQGDAAQGETYCLAALEIWRGSMLR